MCHRRPRTRRPCQGVGGQLLPPPREGPGKEKAISAPRQLFEGASGTFALTSTVPKSAHPVAPGSSLSPASRQTGSFLLPPPPHPLTSLVAALPHLGSLIPTQGSGRVGATGAEWGCWGGRQPHSWGAEGPVVSPPPALGIPGGQLLSGAGGKTAPVIFLCCFNIPALRLCGELGALSSGSCRTSHWPGACLDPGTATTGLRDVTPCGCARLRAGLRVPFGVSFGSWCCSRSTVLSQGAPSAGSGAELGGGLVVPPGTGCPSRPWVQDAHHGPKDRCPSWS